MGRSIQACENLVLDLLEKVKKTGILPWRKPWKDGYSTDKPCNLISKRCYTGSNVFFLLCSAYSSRYWLTYHQAIELGGNVRKGEKGTAILFWKFLSKDKVDTETGLIEEKKFPFQKILYVWNLEQCDIPEEKLSGLMPKETAKPIVTIDTIPDIEKTLLASYPPIVPVIQYGGDRAYYQKERDVIQLPEYEAFKSCKHYAYTLSHELIHSTGHSSRLAREFGHRFGDTLYSKEELVAELGAYFLSRHYGFTSEQTEKNSVGYLHGWLDYLGSNPLEFIKAGTQAQRAYEYIT
jgi:antirestriction protein ArdC